MSELIFLCLGVFLGVCGAFSRVEESQFNQALEFCKGNGGLELYLAKPVGNAEITCVNGARFTLQEEK